MVCYIFPLMLYFLPYYTIKMHELGNIRSLFRWFALLINTQPINTLVISHQQDSFSQNVSSFPLRIAVTTFSYLSRHNFVVFQTITFFVYFLLCNTAASHLRSFILTFRIFYSFHFLVFIFYNDSIQHC